MTKRLLTLVTAIILVLTQFSSLTLSVSAATITYESGQRDLEMDRIAGANRYETAVSISQKGWSTSDYAIVATGEDFPDALCAGPLAAKYNAPILLAGKERISQKTLNELKRLRVKTVYIIGGTNVVSNAVESQIKALAYSNQSQKIVSERIYGKNRTATSVEIAKRLGEFDEVIVATGQNYPDALSVAPVAAQKHIPILLVSRDQTPASVKELIKGRNIKKSYIIGGPSAVGDSVMNDFAAPSRIAGRNRYDTNVRVINNFLSAENQLDLETIFVATGEEFPDALSGSALAVKSHSLILLTAKNPSKVSVDFVLGRTHTNTGAFVISNIAILGGETAVPSSTVDNLMGKGTMSGKLVTLDTTDKEVIYIMGYPRDTRTIGSIYFMVYDDAILYLSHRTSPYQVIGWENKGNRKVSMGEKDPAAPPIKIGSTQAQVVKAVGTPAYVDEIIGAYGSMYGDEIHVSPGWKYPDDSMVYFDDSGKVKGWENKGSLKVESGKPNPDAPPFNLGSTKAQVSEAMGTPDRISDVNGMVKWYYGDSYITFPVYGAVGADAVEDRVWEFKNTGNLKIDMGEENPDAPPIVIGSTKEDIINAMGTPDSVLTESRAYRDWGYHGRGTIELNLQNEVVGWSTHRELVRNDKGQIIGYEIKNPLKVSAGEAEPTAPPIQVGSSEEDVIKAMGTPDGFGQDRWVYGLSSVDFDGWTKKVKSIDNTSHNMKLTWSTKEENAPPFTLGSTIEEVVKAMGGPDKVSDNLWMYGRSSITLRNNSEVIGWDSKGNLRVSMGELDPSAPAIGFGSSVQEVVQAMGTPDKYFRYDPVERYPYNEETVIQWIYGESIIYFDKEGKVTHWVNEGNLKLNVQEPAAGASPITLGSSSQEVLLAMGTPEKITEDSDWNESTWIYGDSNITLNKDGVVTGWLNNGNLRVTFGERNESAEPFYIGSTKEEVAKVLGTPSRVVTNYFGIGSFITIRQNWYYGRSEVHFDSNGRVDYINEEDQPLILGIPDKEPSAPPIDLGVNKEAIARGLGQPEFISKSSDGSIDWSYAGGYIGFNEQGMVIRLSSFIQGIRLGLPAKESDAPPFEAGSSREDVSRVMGPPPWMEMEPSGRIIWKYYDTVGYVYFSNEGKVESWINKGGLRVKE